VLELGDGLGGLFGEAVCGVPAPGREGELLAFEDESDTFRVVDGGTFSDALWALW
jgi:hypothetical protein